MLVTLRLGEVPLQDVKWKWGSHKALYRAFLADEGFIFPELFRAVHVPHDLVLLSSCSRMYFWENFKMD